MPRLSLFSSLLLALFLSFVPAAEAATAPAKTAAKAPAKAPAKTPAKAPAKTPAKAPAPTPAKAPPGPVEIVLRHALTGERAALLVDLVDQFNANSTSEKVRLQHLDAVSNPRQLPHMALLGDDEHQRFFGGYPRLLSLWKALSVTGEQLDTQSLFPVLADVVEDSQGRVQALPLAFAVPVLYYNADMFREAGLDPATPPQTWEEVQEAAGKIYPVNSECPFTSSNMAWVHVDNTTTQHNERMTNPARKGLALTVNGMIQVKHIALLSSWHKSLYFHYFGPHHEADEKFLAGECGMLSGDSSLYAQLMRQKTFAFGVAPLPYHDDTPGIAPERLLPDGALLWILADKKRQEHVAAVHFLQFMMRPEVQREWVKTTGFLPMTPAAVTALADEGEVPPAVLSKVVEHLSDRKYASGAKPRTVLGMGRVRSLLSDELEAVWGNRKPAKEALDTAVKKGNALLRPAPADGTVTQ